MDDAPPDQSALTSWSDRSAFWLAEATRQPVRKSREREQHPLILTGHGLSLRVDKGCLLVRDGNTHYPSAQREWRFFNGALDIPPAFVVIDGSGEITFDAINWLSTQRVPLICLRWNGRFASIVTSGGQAASTEKVDWQRNTRDRLHARLTFGIDIIRQKAENSLRTLEKHFSQLPRYQQMYEAITTRATSLVKEPPRTFVQLLGIEGIIAYHYFRIWPELNLKWKARKQHPIPQNWHAYRTRTSLRKNIRLTLSKSEGPYNRGANHPVNAMMNYAYAVLTAQMQIRLMAAGYDPTIGIMHARAGRAAMNPAFALDCMEPLRPVVDRAVLELIDAVTFSGADFSIQHDGACRLNPELARRVAQLACQHIAAADISGLL
jgi:CRISP-associated protein Cas1